MSELNVLASKLDEIQHRREALVGTRAKGDINNINNIFAVFGQMTLMRRLFLTYSIGTSSIFTIGIGHLLIELI